MRRIHIGLHFEDDAAEFGLVGPHFTLHGHPGAGPGSQFHQRVAALQHRRDIDPLLSAVQAGTHRAVEQCEAHQPDRHREADRRQRPDA